MIRNPSVAGRYGHVMRQTVHCAQVELALGTSEVGS